MNHKPFKINWRVFNYILMIDIEYKNISEIRNNIKSLLNNLICLEDKKYSCQEELLDRIIFLLEVYIKQGIKIELEHQLKDYSNIGEL